MKKTLPIVLAIFGISIVSSQTQPADTLFANEHQIVSLFFDSPIEKGIVGAGHFIFTYNQETPEPLGLLQAKKGVESNLLVVTQNGNIYSLVLAYRDSLVDFHRFVDCSKSLDTPSKLSTDKVEEIPKVNLDYDKLCKQLLRNTDQFHQIKTTGDIRLKMTNSIYHNKEVYVVYEIKNGSAIDYQIDQLQLLKVLGNPKRRSSHQETSIEPLHAFRMPKIVAQGNTMRFVVVYPKFTLGDDYTLKVILQERDGSRNFGDIIK